MTLQDIPTSFSDDDEDIASSNRSRDQEFEDSEGDSDSDSEESEDSEDSGAQEDDGGQQQEPRDDNGGADDDGSSSSSDSGGGGGASSPAAAAAAPSDADKKKKWEERKKRWKERQAEKDKKDAVAKSIERNKRRTAKPVSRPKDVVYQAPTAAAARTVIPQTASVVERAATIAPFQTRPTVAAPAPAPARRLYTPPRIPAAPVAAPSTRSTSGSRRIGYEDLSWELGENVTDSTFGLLTRDDMVAIHKYMVEQMAINPTSTKIKDDFLAWFDKLYWYEISDQDNFDRARNYRNQFNLANAPTPEARAVVEEVMKKGTTKEQALGDPDRRLSSGMFPEHPIAIIPLPWKIAGGVAAFLVVIVAAHGAASSAVR